LVILTLISVWIAIIVFLSLGLAVYYQGPRMLETWVQSRMGVLVEMGVNYANGAAKQVCEFANDELVAIGFPPIPCDDLNLFNITETVSQSQGEYVMGSVSDLSAAPFSSQIEHLQDGSSAST
jgi:hypothetical protein